MHATDRIHTTEAAFLARPDAHAHRELLDGDVLVTPSPSPWHQGLVGRLHLLLSDWQRVHLPAGSVALAPLDIRFGPGRILHPDVAVLPHALSRSAPSPITATPRLCVEVLSPSTATYDRHTKRLVYAEAGVGELWTVDPDGAVEVFHGPGLRSRTLCADALVSPGLTHLTVDLAALFRE